MAGGKFKKPQRGGGRTFSRRIEAVHTNGVSAYRDREESGDSSAESSEASESGSGSESESEEEVVVAKKPANAASLDVSNPNRAAGSRIMKASDLTTPIEMSRKEREAAEKEAAKQKYWKLHQEGKTDQAKADMARLAVIRQKREEAAAQRLAEAQARDEAAAAKAEARRRQKGKKLGWEIIKLQAQVGETTSRKAKKVVQAERKKEGASTAATTGEKDDAAAAEEESEAISEATQKLQQLKAIKISQKIYHARKEIKKAFVKAKSFETQRLVKRLREARKAVENGSQKKEAQADTAQDTKPAGKKKQEMTQEDVAKFEHELELVKKMDMETLSEHAFVAKLGKHPILGSHALMEPYVNVKDPKKNGAEATVDKPAQDALIQIIEARLTNTKTVKEHMAKLWDELEHIVTGKKVDHQELKNKKRKAGDQEDDEESKMAKKVKANTKTQDTSDSGSEDEDEDLELADMSDISDSEGEGDDGYDSDGLPLGNNNGRPSSAAASMFIGSLNAGNSKADKKNKKSKDKNDWVDDKFDEIYGKVKKNRPGQRARREKAERKFGKEANHIKKAEEEARLREERKAARKAKQERFNGKNASTANAQRLPNRRTIGAGDGSASVPNVPKPRTPSGPDLNDPTLHPSWIAKQSEKAAMAAALSGAKSNKIVFDDSD
ncbi:heat- and acid-stable phosphoprotein [Mortierella alpina]|nr:heat- and acid-stable phosphoprotein [Mortierella alpina]